MRRGREAWGSCADRQTHRQAEPRSSELPPTPHPSTPVSYWDRSACDFLVCLSAGWLIPTPRVVMVKSRLAFRALYCCLYILPPVPEQTLCRLWGPRRPGGHLAGRGGQLCFRPRCRWGPVREQGSATRGGEDLTQLEPGRAAGSAGRGHSPRQGPFVIYLGDPC